MTPDTVAHRNRELIVHGLAEFARGNIGVLRELLHEDFVEHSPGNPSGRDAFLAFIATAPVARARLDIKRVIADDDYAVVHYHMIGAGDGRGSAVIDVWRLVDGRITEHWDVVQPVPEPASTPHGMF
ncbi:nuclear transport factor 2 family protein [Nocardia sp. NPDC051833]|uniref:nuclear transport factor 2 family protein n=1 Tax=Nocardia sp. NPDC051833 TaxID=3155674 RepID=UPI00343CB186